MQIGRWLIVFALGAPACATAAARPVAPPSSGAFTPTTAPTRAQPDAAPDASSRDAGEPCGALGCRRFDDPARALRYVLASAPLVVGIGEAHAQAGSEAIPTTARRFSEQLLPVFAGRSSHVIVELLNPNPDCPTAARPLEETQKPVTEPQSRQNQNDYVELGHRARALGIEPFVLTPTCEEFRAISSSGEDAILKTLSLIASITSRMARAAVVKNRRQGSDQMVLAYGGAMHNDLQPKPERASFSYADALNEFTGGRYLELDLIVREFIKDNEAWRALPWYGQFDAERFPESSIVLSPAPQRYVLFFPKSEPAPGSFRGNPSR